MKDDVELKHREFEDGLRYILSHYVYDDKYQQGRKIDQCLTQILSYLNTSKQKPVEQEYDKNSYAMGWWNAMSACMDYGIETKPNQPKQDVGCQHVWDIPEGRQMCVKCLMLREELEPKEQKCEHCDDKGYVGSYGEDDCRDCPYCEPKDSVKLPVKTILRRILVAHYDLLKSANYFKCMDAILDKFTLKSPTPPPSVKWPAIKIYNGQTSWNPSEAIGWNACLDEFKRLNPQREEAKENALVPLDVTSIEIEILKMKRENDSGIELQAKHIAQMVCQKFGATKALPYVEELAKELHWIEGINSNPERRKKAWEICKQKDEYIIKAKSIHTYLLNFRGQPYYANHCDHSMKAKQLT